MSVLRRAALCALVALPVVAQPPGVSAIRITRAGAADTRSPRIKALGNGDVVASAVPAITLLSYAYDVPSNPSPRLSVLPEWTVREKYDIEVKATANAVSSGLPGNETRRRAQQMIRGLLSDRFKLAMRVENRRMPVYALTVASGGPKLQRSTMAEQDCVSDSRSDVCHNFVGGLGHPLNAEAIDMDDLAHYIGNWTDLPVVNRTSLSGLYTAHTEGWVPMRLPPPPPNAAAAANPFAGLPTIFTVLGKLGLELKRQEDTLPVYIVEHIERPAAQ